MPDEPKKMRIIALTGPKGCGKDTIAKGLFKNNRDKEYFRQIQVAAGAKGAAMALHGLMSDQLEDPALKETPLDRFPYLCPRQLTIDLANWARDTYGAQIHALNAEREMLEYSGVGCFVITDMRFPEELDMLRRNNGILVYVDRAVAEEALALKQNGGDVMANNVSESHYALMLREADIVLDNNGTIAQAHGLIQSIVTTTYGYWGYWPDVERTALSKLRTGEL